MTETSDRWKSRADQAGDGFRALSSVLVAALLAFSVDLHEEKNGWLSETEALASQVAGILALVLLGWSWVIQKSKSLARDRTEGALPNRFIFRNELYDVTAFSLFLFAVGILIFAPYDCTFALSVGIAAIFAAVVTSINREIKLLEATTRGSSEAKPKQ